MGEFLKQSEIFAFFAAFFLLAIVLLQNKQQENPPIIILNERNAAYRFESGSATVPQAFRNALQNRIIPLLDSLSDHYDCDAIEVVGHTDETHIEPPTSNLDENIITSFNNGRVESLQPGSNVDLGMMRALAIMTILKRAQRRGYLKKIDYFFPYSAGQMIKLNRRIPTTEERRPDRARRRIEIRLLKPNTRQLE